MVAGSSIPQPKPSLQGLSRLFLSLPGSREQWDEVAGSVFPASAGSAAGTLPGPAAPVLVAAPSACLSASVLALGGGSLAGAASATGSAGQREHSRESSHSEWRRQRSSSGERSQSSKKSHRGQSPSSACPSRLASASASSSSAPSVADVQGGVMPPPPTGRSGVGGGRSECDRSAAGRDRLPRPGPSGLGSGSRSSLVGGPSHLRDGGRSSPSSSGVGDDDRSSTVDSLDLDRDNSFQAVSSPHPGVPQFGGTDK